MSRSKKRKMMAALTAVSAAAVLMVGSPAWADSVKAQGTASVTNSNSNPEMPPTTTGTTSANVQRGNVGQYAKGNVNVQQNNGSNSAVQQNVAIGAQDINGTSSTTSSSVLTIGSTNGATVSGNTNTLPQVGTDSPTNNGLTNTIRSSSFRDASGNINDSQNNGSGNAMQQSTAIGISASGQSSAVTQKVTSSNSATVSNNTNNAFDSALENKIRGNAFYNATGNVNAQQNNGSNNAMQQSTSVGAQNVTYASGASLAGSSNATNSTSVSGTDNTYDTNVTNSIHRDAFENATGNVNAQQNNGSNNAMQQSTAVGVSSSSIVGASNGASAKNTASSVTGTESFDGFADDPSNSIHGDGFRNATGNVNVQQNNGSNNAVQQSTSVGVALNAPTVSGDPDSMVTNTGTVSNSGSTVSSALMIRNSLTGNAFQNATGNVNVQQNNGSNNAMQQSTAVDAYVNFDALASDSAGLTNWGNSTGNTGTLSDAVLKNHISHSAFQNATGNVNVQQNNGANNMIQQGSSVGVYDVGTIAGPDGSPMGSVTQTETGYSQNSSSTVEFSSLANGMGGNAFQNATGNVNAQQNNGANNTLQQGIAVGVEGSPVVSIGALASSSTLNGTVSGNTAQLTDVTLHNTLHGNAFQNVAGNVNISQNNGSNNVMEQSVSVGVFSH